VEPGRAPATSAVAAAGAEPSTARAEGSRAPAVPGPAAVPRAGVASAQAVTPAGTRDETPAAPARRAAPERPAVQVEIGRVEVVSHAPGTAGTPRPPRARPMTSLEEYARRWGGGRR
jgi:hypothetical protein